MTFFPFQAASENPQVAMALAVLVGFGFGFVLERAGFGDARKLARPVLRHRDGDAEGHVHARSSPPSSGPSCSPGSARSTCARSATR